MGCFFSGDCLATWGHQKHFISVLRKVIWQMVAYLHIQQSRWDQNVNSKSNTTKLWFIPPCFGLWIDPELNFKPHVEHIMKKVIFGVSVLYHYITFNITFTVRKTFASHLILPILDCPEIVYQSASKTNLHSKMSLLSLLFCSVFFNQAADLVIQQSSTLKTKPDVFTFGTVFTDHMLTIEWSAAEGWQAPLIKPFENLSVHPACSSLHYGVQVQ